MTIITNFYCVNIPFVYMFITFYSEFFSLQIYILNTSIILHIGIGAILFLVTISTWALENFTLLRMGYDKYKRRASLKTD